MWAVKADWMTSLKWRAKIIDYIAVLGFATVIYVYISYFLENKLQLIHWRRKAWGLGGLAPPQAPAKGGWAPPKNRATLPSCEVHTMKV